MSTLNVHLLFFCFFSSLVFNFLLSPPSSIELQYLHRTAPSLSTKTDPLDKSIGRYFKHNGIDTLEINLFSISTPFVVCPNGHCCHSMWGSKGSTSSQFICVFCVLFWVMNGLPFGQWPLPPKKPTCTNRLDTCLRIKFAANTEHFSETGKHKKTPVDESGSG